MADPRPDVLFTRVHTALQQLQLPHFDFAFQPSLNEQQVRDLAALRFITNAENLLLLGPPGVGKTHLAVALVMAALTRGCSVYFSTVADLLETLARDARADQLAQRMQTLCRSRCSSSGGLTDFRIPVLGILIPIFSGSLKPILISADEDAAVQAV